jgi:hypothetical protein
MGDMTDDQPRWPKGTPVAPGGKGPGGGRFRGKAGDLEAAMAGWGGGGPWMAVTLGLDVPASGPLPPQRPPFTAVFDRARRDPTSGRIELVRDYGTGVETSLSPGMNVEVTPLGGWIGQVVDRMDRRRGVARTSRVDSTMAEPAMPDAQPGTAYDVAELLEQGHRVQVYHPYGQLDDRWSEVQAAEVVGEDHVGLRMRLGQGSDIFTHGPEVLQYRIVGRRETPNPPVLRADRVIGYPEELPADPTERQREEIMQNLGGPPIYPQRQMRRVFEQFGIEVSEDDLAWLIDKVKPSFAMPWSELGNAVVEYLAQRGNINDLVRVQKMNWADSIRPPELHAAMRAPLTNVALDDGPMRFEAAFEQYLKERYGYESEELDRILNSEAFHESVAPDWDRWVADRPGTEQILMFDRLFQNITDRMLYYGEGVDD